MDKVQKIREEVEKIARSINLYIPDEEGKNSEYEAGRFAVVIQIMQIIDSMQEEPVAPKVLEDILNAKTAAESLGISQEEHDRIVDELIYGKEPELVDVDDLPKEEPVSEDLLVAANKAFQESEDKESYAETFEDGFVAGADWQKRKDSISSKDLEELINTLSKRYPEVSFAKLSRIAVRVAKWQKEQVAKKAGDWVDTNIEKYISADGEYNVDWSITDDLEKHLNVE